MLKDEIDFPSSTLPRQLVTEGTFPAQRRALVAVTPTKD